MDTLPLYLAFLGTAIGLLVVFTWGYMKITSFNELALIREGNRTAAISLGGLLIGFGLALSGTAANSAGVLDLLMWGGVSLASQLATYYAATFLLKDFRKGLEADKTSYGILLAAMSIAMGLINAGAVTY